MNATDPILAREYTQSLTALEGRLAKRKQVTSFLDQVEAQITSLTTTLEDMLAETLRLQAMGAQEIERNQKQMIARLRQEAEELKVFEGEGGMPNQELEVNLPPVS